MEMQFKYALAAVGILLIGIGLFSALSNLSSSAQGEFIDALSAGFSYAFNSFFSGVLIGVGAAFLVDALLQSLSRRSQRELCCTLLCVVGVAVAASSIIEVKQISFLSLVLFFSSISFAIGMAISCTTMGLVDLASHMAGVKEKPRRR